MEAQVLCSGWLLCPRTENICLRRVQEESKDVFPSSPPPEMCSLKENILPLPPEINMLTKYEGNLTKM